MTESWALSSDLSEPYLILAGILAGLSLIALFFEVFRNGGRRHAALLGSGVVSILLLSLAVLRPVSVFNKGTLVGPRVTVLLDRSRSMQLGADGGTRIESAEKAIFELRKRGDIRLDLEAFGDPLLWAADRNKSPESGTAFFSRSDLGAALEELSRGAGERPSAVVVLSDGRLDRPAETSTEEATRSLFSMRDVPIHTVQLTAESPPDASIREVRVAGAAVAHQPFSLRIEVGCERLECKDISVAARELREQVGAQTLATGEVHVDEGKGIIELPITLERAGTRILEVELAKAEGDAIAENNVRYIPIDVGRDRVRVLHVAGRPTYDVRALRMWLKSDAAVDVIAFFILRTLTDNANAPQDELALIPFPVDELFSDHLPSFDAVVLQDFDAEPYGLTKHLPALARYVERGGGLIMVGGPDAFVPGHYARTPIARVLPVSLDLADRASRGVDLGGFVPRVTEAGRVSPVFGPLRALIGESFPEMPGTNLVEDRTPNATVLLEHPTQKTRSGKPMPVLALSEVGSGRTIALTVDGSHRLLFSAFAANAGGRAHGAFWDAMLGWLMRDPRFEPATIDLPRGCFSDDDTEVVLRRTEAQKGDPRLRISRLSTKETPRVIPVQFGDQKETRVRIGRLEPGGYSAALEFGEGNEGSAPAHRDFACERGGDEWADSRVDPERLRAIARATSGKSIGVSEMSSLALPNAVQVASERRVAPIAPAWLWSLLAAVSLGAHWIARRRTGLA